MRRIILPKHLRSQSQRAKYRQKEVLRRAMQDHGLTVRTRKKPKPEPKQPRQKKPPKPKKPPGRPPSLTMAQAAALKVAAKDGAITIAQAAKHLGIPRSTAYDWLKRMKVKPKSPRMERCYRIPPAQWLVLWREKGMTTTEIAVLAGCSAETVRRIVKRLREAYEPLDD